MQLDFCQRWNRRRTGWAEGERIDPRRHSVEPIPDDRTARAFVARHHYLGTMPPARFRFGLYREGAGLVGVAVFSVPCRDAVVTGVFPGDARSHLDLGRFVLLDLVERYGETWFLARCFEHLRREGIGGVVAFSDPVPRYDADGELLMPGHVGTIYQAFNGCYLGRRRAESVWVLRDGRTMHRRTLAKIRKRDRGWEAAARRLVELGAEEPGDDVAAWVERTLAQLATRKRHPGNHKYAWAVDRRLRRHLPRSFPFPKKGF